MTIIAIDALTGLRAALSAPPAQQLATFRERVMTPLAPFWEPMMAYMPAGAATEPADMALMAARTFGYYSPEHDGERGLDALDRLDQAGAWPACLSAVEAAWAALAPADHGVPLERVRFTLVLGDPAKLGEDLDSYTGFGGMPGLVMVMAWPTDSNLPRLPAATVHELNHNIRFSVEPFMPDRVTVGQYIVAEGLAEAFAAEQCGAERLGPWAMALTEDEVAAVRPRYREALTVSGFDEVRGYIFGDGAAATFGYRPQGLPNYAGYTIGYRIVREYLALTGLSAAAATYRPWREIVDDSGYLLP